MKIGVIGWYGYNNYGDERMLYCIKKFFSDCELLVVNGWNDARKKLKDLNNCDYLLIGGGGLILRGIERNMDLIKALKTPFGLVGISVEAKHRTMMKFINLLKKKVDFIYVRDKKSKFLLDNHYKVITGPDISFLYPFKIISEVKEDVCGLNLRDFYYWKSQLNSSFYKLMLKLNKRFPSIKNYYPFDLWDPDRTLRIIKHQFDKIIPLPFYFYNKNVVNDVDVLSKYFKDVPDVFNIELYDKIRYLVGMRYHSLVFAVQCGIPFISLSYQPKNINFCSELDLDTLSIDIYNLSELNDKIQYLIENYSMIRTKLLSYREKYVNEVNYIFKRIKALIV